MNEVTLQPTELLMISNHGEVIDMNTKLIELLKHSSTEFIATKVNRFANLSVMIQHKKERKLLVLEGDLSVSELKKKCLVSFNEFIN